MGFWDWIAGYYLAKRAENAVMRPTVVAPEGYTVVGMKPQGAYHWTVRFRKNGSSVTDSFTVSHITTGYSCGGGWFEISW